MTNIKLWYKRWFKILSIEECEKIGLTWYRNVYGDEINHINCRSIWVDNKNRTYRCTSLVTCI